MLFPCLTYVNSTGIACIDQELTIAALEQGSQEKDGCIQELQTQLEDLLQVQNTSASSSPSKSAPSTPTMRDIYTDTQEEHHACEGGFLLIYICNFHVLSQFLLIYICKLH